jgi:hypothetical protein
MQELIVRGSKVGRRKQVRIILWEKNHGNTSNATVEASKITDHEIGDRRTNQSNNQGDFASP